MLLDTFFEVDERRKSGVPFGTNIFDIYKDLYEREFKSVPRNEQRVSIIDAKPAVAPFIEAAFSGFPATGLLRRSDRSMLMRSLQSSLQRVLIIG